MINSGESNEKRYCRSGNSINFYSLPRECGCIFCIDLCKIYQLSRIVPIFNESKLVTDFRIYLGFNDSGSSCTFLKYLIGSLYFFFCLIKCFYFIFFCLI